MDIELTFRYPVQEELYLNLATTANVQTSKDRKRRLKPRRFHKKFKVRCPWAGCSNDPLIWHCAHCGNELETFEQEEIVYFSCYCSDRKMTDFYWKCCHNNHPKVRFEENFKSLMELQKDQREQRTIVFLGETGVGKSTTINHLITSINYETWDEAWNAECVDAVSLWDFFTTAENQQKQKQLQGNYIENENGEEGKSSTKNPVTYSFIFKDEGKEYLMMVVDTAGNNDASGCVEVDDKHHMDIVQQTVTLGYFNMLCFIFKHGDNIIHRNMPHLLKVMKTILTPQFVNHTSFLQTYSSATYNFNVNAIKRTICNMSKEYNIELECNNNIYPVNNEAYKAIMTDKSLNAEYIDQKTTYDMSRNSFRELCKKAIRNQKLKMKEEDIQIARIKKFSKQDLETIFEYTLEFAGINNQNRNLKLDESVRKMKQMDSEIARMAKEFYKGNKHRNSGTSIEIAKDACDVEVYEEFKILLDSPLTEKTIDEMYNILDTTDFDIMNDPKIKELLREIKIHVLEFKDELYFYIGIGLIITGVIAIGAGITMFAIPPPISFALYGGTGIAGGVTSTTGALTVLLGHLKCKKSTREKAMECIKAIAVINKYCKNNDIDVSFDYISELKKAIDGNSQGILFYLKKLLNKKKHFLFEFEEECIASFKDINLELQDVLASAEALKKIGVPHNLHYKYSGKELFVDWRIKSENSQRIQELWDCFEFHE